MNKAIAKNSTGRARVRGRPPGSTFARDAISTGGLGHLTPDQRRARKEWLAGWRTREGQYAGLSGIASENTPPERPEHHGPFASQLEGDPADVAAMGAQVLFNELERA